MKIIVIACFFADCFSSVFAFADTDFTGPSVFDNNFFKPILIRWRTNFK